MTQTEVERAIVENVASGAGVASAVAGEVWNRAIQKGSEDGTEEPGIMRELFDIARIRLRQKSYELYGRMKDSIRSCRMRRPQTLSFGV